MADKPCGSMPRPCDKDSGDYKRGEHAGGSRQCGRDCENETGHDEAAHARTRKRKLHALAHRRFGSEKQYPQCPEPSCIASQSPLSSKSVCPHVAVVEPGKLARSIDCGVATAQRQGSIFKLVIRHLPCGKRAHEAAHHESRGHVEGIAGHRTLRCSMALTADRGSRARRERFCPCAADTPPQGSSRTASARRRCSRGSAGRRGSRTRARPPA